MSSSSPPTVASKSNEGQMINNASVICQNLEKLHDTGDQSDVMLIVEGEKLNAHKLILASQSQYFQALFFGNLKEASQDEIELKDIKLEAFKRILKYVYTGNMLLQNTDTKILLDVLGLAHHYALSELEKSLCVHLKTVLNVQSVCAIVDAAQLYQINDLLEECFIYLDNHVNEIFQEEDFLQLSPEILSKLTSRTSFFASEIKIFQAIEKWIKANPGKDAKQILDNLRLGLISNKDLLNVVRRTGLIPQEIILNELTERIDRPDTELNYRGKRLLSVNVAQRKFDSEVIEGDNIEQLILDNRMQDISDDSGYAWHEIDDSNDSYVTVKLGSPFIINFIKILLKNTDSTTYSFFVEISMNEEDWLEIANHRNFSCCDWQYFYFDPRVVRFIRMTGTSSSQDDKEYLDIVKVSASYLEKPAMNHVNGFAAPLSNIAVRSFGTYVSSSSINHRCLLNGKISGYDNRDGYTSPGKGSNSIIIRFSQPFIINSMRFLLWDCDNRYYSYYVSVYDRKRDWRTIVDRSTEKCQSWQSVFCESNEPFIHVKITCTHDSANEGLRLVHFECPAVTDFEDENTTL